MNDTPRDIELRMLALFAERTPEERVRMACGMFDAGIALMKAGILDKQPDLTESQLRVEIFRRLYGDCFSTKEMERIELFLSNGRPEPAS